MSSEPPVVEVILAETEAERRWSMATRVSALGDLEDYRGVQPGQPVDAADRRPDTDHFVAFVNGIACGVGRVEYYPHTQSRHILAQQGVTVNAQFCEPTRTGVAPEYRGTETGKRIGRQIVGRQVLRSLEQGCRYWGLTMRAWNPVENRPGGMFWLLQDWPWHLLPQPISYPPQQGGPNSKEPILVATLDLWLAQLATYLLQPKLYGLMFPAQPEPLILSDLLDDLKNALGQQAKRNQVWVGNYLERWQQGLEQPLAIT